MTDLSPYVLGSEDSTCLISLRYEELREQWLRHTQIHKNGLALFLNEGMAAWAAQWAICTLPLKREPLYFDEQSWVSMDAVEPKPAIEGDLVSEITRLLATMTLRAAEGAWLKA